MRPLKITSRYLRFRLGMILLAITMAAITSHQVSKISHRNVLARVEAVNAFDEAQAAIIEDMIRLQALGGATRIGRANAERTEMRRSWRKLAAARDAIERADKRRLFSEETSALLDRPMLDLVGLLDDFLLAVKSIASPDGPWGAAAARKIEVARASASKALPIIRRMKLLEHEDLKRVNAQLAEVSDLALVLIIVFLLGSTAFIFLPMERRIIAAQEEIRHKQELAEAASAAKSQFLATMSHEIRTPMNGVLGMAELLVGSRLEDRQRKMVEVIRQSGQGLLAIINDILDFSKIEAEKIELATEPFDLRGTVAHLFNLLKPQADKKGLDFRLTIDARLASAHLGDEVRVGQILTNLVGNALKFTRQGRVVVGVAAEPATDGTQAVRIEVTDTGVGISAENLDHIFDPFEQADGSSTRSFGGTGLGLAISSRLAQAMGGRITVESTLGRGSLFTLHLTLPVAVAATPRGSGAETQAMRGFGRQPRVLVAEDNETNQLVIAQMLELVHCEPILAGDGAEAVARFVATRPDLVLMDVSMPGMDGNEATQAIRQHEQATNLRPTPVIGLTAHAAPADRDCCLEAGMEAVLLKPLSLDDLRRALGEHLPDTPLRISA
jgi:signal transduction histidine kinase/ActR/RegA family two-component response regulator